MWIVLRAMDARSLGLGKFPREELGMERMPRARRMRTRKVKTRNRVRISVEDDDDLRGGRREYLGFAIVEAQDRRDLKLLFDETQLKHVDFI